MSSSFLEMVATEIRNIFMIDYSLKRVADTETSKSNEIYRLFVDAINNTKNLNKNARKILSLMPEDHVEVIFGFRKTIRTIISKFLLKMTEAISDNSNNSELMNFSILLGLLFNNDIIELEDFKIYIRFFREVALVNEKSELIEKILQIIADKLKEMKLTKNKFLESLDRESGLRKIPDELHDDNESYKFDSNSYVKLNILNEAQHIGKRFENFLENPSSNFDLQLIIKGNEQNNLDCALALYQKAKSSKTSHKELAKIVERIENIPKCSYDRNVESFCTTIQSLIQTRFQKVYKDDLSLKMTGNTLENVRSFMTELKKLNLSFPFSVKKTLANGMKKTIEISSSGLSYKEYNFEGFSFDTSSSPPRFNIYNENQSELTAALKSIKILIHHINHPTFTYEKLQTFIKITQKMLEKCNNEEKKIFNEKVFEIVELKLNFYFPSSEFDKTADYGDKVLEQFITILCELFNLEMIESEIFMKFATKLYKNVKNDDWKKLQKYFTQLFNASYDKIQQTAPEIFNLMSHLNKEHLEVTKIIENFNQHTKFDKNFKSLIESGKDLKIFQADKIHVPKYIASRLVAYACTLENSTAVIEALKKVKNMKNIYIDKAMNKQFEIACKNFFKSETILNLSLICCLRELIFHRLMTRRGLARIYKILFKYFKICETLSKSIEIVLKYTLSCFLGGQLLENDIKDILEVMLKYCENYPPQKVEYCKGLPEIIYVLKTSLENHEKNAQRITLRQQEVPTKSEEEQENILDVTEDEMKMLNQFAIKELLAEISEFSSINKAQLKIHCVLGNDIKIEMESNEIENLSKMSIVFDMNEEFQAKFKEVFVNDIISELTYGKNEENVVKLMAALINSKVINSDQIRKFINSFLPLNNQNLKLLNNFLKLIKETLIESDEKSTLNKIKNQLKKFQKKKNGKDLRNQVLEKVMEILTKIDKKNQPEEIKSQKESLKTRKRQSNEEILNLQTLSFVLDPLQQKHSEKLLELLENSQESSSSQKILSNNFKIDLIEFIKELSNQEELTTNFIISLFEILYSSTVSESSNFAAKVFMKIFGEKLQKEDLEKFMKFSDFQEKGWNNAKNFNEIFDFDEILIDFHLNEAAIDEFIAKLWMILLQNGSDEKLLLIVRNCLTIHEDFKRKLINFMVARCETFQMLDSEILGKEKVKERLGKVAVFILELYKMQLINDYCFTNMLTSKLIDKIPNTFLTKIVEILAKIEFNEEQMMDINLQKIILQFEWTQKKIFENNLKEINEILYENKI